MRIQARNKSISVLRDLEIQGNRQRGIKGLHLARVQSANEVREKRLGKAHQAVAMDAALVFHPLVRPDQNLRRQAIEPGIDWSADRGREPGVNQDLAADNDKDSGSFGILGRWFRNTVEVTASQGST